MFEKNCTNSSKSTGRKRVNKEWITIYITLVRGYQLHLSRRVKKKKLRVDRQDLIPQPAATCYKQPLKSDTHSFYYTQHLLHAAAVIHSLWYTQLLLHTVSDTHSFYYMQPLTHTTSTPHRLTGSTTHSLTGSTTHRLYHPQPLLHTGSPSATHSLTGSATHNLYYTQAHTLCYTQPHRLYYTQALPPTTPTTHRLTPSVTHSLYYTAILSGK